MATLRDYIKIKHGYAFKGKNISTIDNNIVLVTPGNFAIGGGFKEEKCKYFDAEYPDDYVLKKRLIEKFFYKRCYEEFLSEQEANILEYSYNTDFDQERTKLWINLDRIRLIRTDTETRQMNREIWPVMEILQWDREIQQDTEILCLDRIPRIVPL